MYLYVRTLELVQSTTSLFCYDILFTNHLFMPIALYLFIYLYIIFIFVYITGRFLRPPAALGSAAAEFRGQWAARIIRRHDERRQAAVDPRTAAAQGATGNA